MMGVGLFAIMFNDMMRYISNEGEGNVDSHRVEFAREINEVQESDLKLRNYSTSVKTLI